MHRRHIHGKPIGSPRLNPIRKILDVMLAHVRHHNLFDDARKAIRDKLVLHITRMTLSRRMHLAIDHHRILVRNNQDNRRALKIFAPTPLPLTSSSRITCGNHTKRLLNRLHILLALNDDDGLVRLRALDHARQPIRHRRNPRARDAITPSIFTLRVRMFLDKCLFPVRLNTPLHTIEQLAIGIDVIIRLDKLAIVTRRLLLRGRLTHRTLRLNRQRLDLPRRITRPPPLAIIRHQV